MLDENTRLVTLDPSARQALIPYRLLDNDNDRADADVRTLKQCSKFLKPPVG